MLVAGYTWGDTMVESSRVWAMSVEHTLLGLPEPVIGVLKVK